jgi:serine/threonine protein kinase
MPVQVRCPNRGCGALFNVSDAEFARRVSCQKCGQTFSPIDTQSWVAPPAGAPDPVLVPPRPTELPGGTVFGSYRIVRRLGRGGMGTVYLAHDTQLRRDVALKVPRITPDGSPQVVKRFYREARALARLGHPNICPVYDVGQVGGIPFLTMPYIEGRPLSALVTQPPLPERQAAEVVRTLARVLAEAHALGIIHRDLKPSNVMIGPRDELIIMDFGLARLIDPGDLRLTRTGAPLGTPAYMSPEQAIGDPAKIGPGCDIYSLGVILYELLTGRRPFEGPPLMVLGMVTFSEPPPPSVYRRDLDRRLEAICLRAMAKAVPDRHSSMVELAEALDGYLCDSASVGSVPEDHASRSDRTLTIPGPKQTTGPTPEATSHRRMPARRLNLVMAVLGVLVLLGIITGIAVDIQATWKDSAVPTSPKLVTPEIDGVSPPLSSASTDSGPSSPSPSLGMPSEPAPSARATTGRGTIYETLGSGPISPSSGVGPPTLSLRPTREQTNSLGLAMALIPAGEFAEGSTGSEPNAYYYETSQRHVRITRPFYLSRFEVTQAQFRQIMGVNPSRFRGDGRLPVEGVSWFEAVAFCNRLSGREGLDPYYRVTGREVTILGGQGYRLPTEAEWEYACRAGNSRDSASEVNAPTFGDYAWYNKNAGGRPQAVGQKAPNAWGLYDMHGNVWEWCWDWYEDHYHGQSPADDPTGPLQGTGRVIRGGGWGYVPSYDRLPNRNWSVPDFGSNSLGFRVARDGTSC